MEEAKQEYGQEKNSEGRGSGNNIKGASIPKTKDIAELVRKSKEYTQALIEEHDFLKAKHSRPVIEINRELSPQVASGSISALNDYAASAKYLR